MADITDQADALESLIENFGDEVDALLEEMLGELEDEDGPEAEHIRGVIEKLKDDTFQQDMGPLQDLANWGKRGYEHASGLMKQYKL